jgi:sugar lactone lactonase YvrE
MLRLAGVATLAASSLLAIPLASSAQGGETVMFPYATDLVAPRGLEVDANGYLVVAEQGEGRVVRLRDLDGDQMANLEAERKDVVNGLPFIIIPGEGPGVPPEIVGASDIAFDANGELYVVTNGVPTLDPYGGKMGAIWSTAAPNDSTNPFRVANPYANLALYELNNNPDGDIIESNPYSVVVDAEGNAYVNDAAANATLKVAPDGTISTYAVYPPVPVDPQWGFPFTHFVPTGIAMGADGEIYVAGLTGFPFAEGASTLYKLVDEDGDGDAQEEGEMTVVAEGLTTVTGLAIDTDGGVLATEFRGPLNSDDFASGRVVKINADGEIDVVAEGLVTPTGIAVGADGTIYVSMEFAGVVMQIHRAAE